MKTFLKLQWAKLQLWFILYWYGMDRIERGLHRMAKEVTEQDGITTYVLDGAVVRTRRTRYVLEVEEKK